MFASTPPLEALRWLLSEAATIDEPSTSGWDRNAKLPSGQLCGSNPIQEEKVVLISDVSRAFFEAPMKRKLAVELPAEALGPEDEGKDLVGILEMSLYGTRDAAVNFQREVAKLMDSLGYRQSVYNTSLYHHKQKGIKVLVHGDDFVAVGGRKEINNFKQQFGHQIHS